MGQKINPIGLRLGINRGWDSTWFAKKKDFGKYLIEDFKIRNYIKKNIVNSGVSEIIIERSSNIDFFSSSNKDEETSLIGNCDLTAQETKVASLSDDKIVIICKNRIEVIDINNQKILKVINYN